MSDESVTTNGRASLQTIDARVGRLEDAQGKTDIAITAIQSEQVHLRELMTARFTSIESTLAAQGAEFKNFVGRMENLILEATRNSGDLDASPAGRDVNKRLTALEAKGDLHDSFIDRFQGMSTAVRWAIGTSGIAFLIGIATLAKMAGLY